MATYQQRGDTWRAIVRLKGVYESKTFDKKAQAQRWATQRESEIRSGATGTVPDKTFGDLLKRYLSEVTPAKPGARWEAIRINAFLKDPIAEKRLTALDRTHFADWRDRRLLKVAPGTVRREWTVMSGVCTKAIIDWRWLDTHPMKGVKLPDKPDHRDRLISQDEIDKLVFCLGYSEDSSLDTVSARVGAAFLFAIETGMRAGEIAALTQGDLFLTERYVKIRGLTVGGRKTRAAKRDVPLSEAALSILRRLTHERVFNISTSSIDALFRRARDKAGVEGLHFHDTRHEAITRLAKKMDVLPLARMIGHTDLKQLLVYYNQTASELAKLL